MFAHNIRGNTSYHRFDLGLSFSNFIISNAITYMRNIFPVLKIKNVNQSKSILIDRLIEY